ncbi:hypothetical protein BS47DRAFT_1398747 [Hydnum rufescens UP504]|uniref:Uncharacterized protein n=1 Tax=Hydnum rufescens UP504 TaxID=1448309 RepID=A0A9P6AK06_9AGAM|nr:hypothetical protein BS47DRAFT_1398747 [Hydnum rufescens UP504]
MPKPQTVWLDLSIQQADLEASLAQLSARIKKGVQQLMDKDKACARALQRAQSDAFLALRLQALETTSTVHSLKQIPKELDIDRLFNVDLDESIWEDAGLDLDEGDVPPAWLADDATREGIKAVQLFDCTGEEILQLRHEFHALVLWLTEESEAACRAQLNCKAKKA